MAANVKNLPLSVIFAAKSGDGQALGAVLNHYQRYIRSLATRTLTDECGNKVYYVDEEIRLRLEGTVDLLHCSRFQNLAGITFRGGSTFPFPCSLPWLSFRKSTF